MIAVGLLEIYLVFIAILVISWKSFHAGFKDGCKHERELRGSEQTPEEAEV